MAESSDVLIIGAGPAGLTAAIYVCRAGWTATILDKGFYGGQVAITPEVENYPGCCALPDQTCLKTCMNRRWSFGAQVRFEEVRKLTLEGERKRALTSGGEYESRAVILANGAKRRHLGCPGEEEFAGRGVSYCATCDGAVFKGKDVVLVGGETPPWRTRCISPRYAAASRWFTEGNPSVGRGVWPKRCKATRISGFSITRP